MKKILLLMTAAALFSPLCYADYDDYQRGRGNWGHEHHHRQYYQPAPRYYPQPPVRYYQQPPVNYYAQPPAVYYQQPPIIYSQPRYSGNEFRLSW